MRVSKSGKRTYICKFRTPDGRRRDRKLGDASALIEEAARKAVTVRVYDIVKPKNSFAKTPVKANRVLALLLKMFNLAEEWEYREPNVNPTRHISKYKEEPKARLREVLNMRWDYVDLQAGQIHLPDSKTGRKISFVSNKAKRYISDIRRKPDNPYVFPGQREGSQLINIQKPWRLIRERAKLDGVRIHDLRHIYASLAVAQNLSLPIVGKLLGHKSSKSTERYAHLYTDVMANAANKVGG